MELVNNILYNCYGDFYEEKYYFLLYVKKIYLNYVIKFIDMLCDFLIV